MEITESLPTNFRALWGAKAESTKNISAVGKWTLQQALSWTGNQISPSDSASEQPAQTDTDVHVTRTHTLRKIFDTEPLVPDIKPLSNPISASPVQIWEGEVKSVDWKSKMMEVELNAKIGSLPTHAAEIELRRVAEQDLELVSPGAVFYLTVSDRWDRGTIENVQELRFRRRPSWSRRQIDEIWRDADLLGQNLSSKPSAE